MGIDGEMVEDRRGKDIQGEPQDCPTAVRGGCALAVRSSSLWCIFRAKKNVLYLLSRVFSLFPFSSLPSSVRFYFLSVKSGTKMD
jgi:hypothetical protein